jgi:hypothetical protein
MAFNIIHGHLSDTGRSQPHNKYFQLLQSLNAVLMRIFKLSGFFFAHQALVPFLASEGTGRSGQPQGKVSIPPGTLQRPNRHDNIFRSCSARIEPVRVEFLCNLDTQRRISISSLLAICFENVHVDKVVIHSFTSRRRAFAACGVQQNGRAIAAFIHTHASLPPPKGLKITIKLGTGVLTPQNGCWIKRKEWIQNPRFLLDY